MARIQLFEFGDLNRFPSFLRNYSTDFLQFLSNKTKMFKPIVPVLQNGLERSGNTQIVDLASGGGGGLLWLNEELKKEIPELKIILSDYFPNKDAFEYTKLKADNIESIETPVDARNVPENLDGLRTLFLSFHHFKPEDACLILQNAVDSKSAIAVFEGQERSFPSVLGMFLSPISVLLSTPFIRPFKFGRIFFTYIIPLAPLSFLWDGVVSSFRTYSVQEMNQLVDQLDNKDSFDWDIGRVKYGPTAILYLVGTPRAE